MKLTKQLGLSMAASLIVIACNKPGGTVATTDAQDVAASTGDTLQVDTTSSTLSWTGYKPTGKHHGEIPVTSGMLTVVGDSVTGGSFTFDITGLSIEDMKPSDESYGKLYGHLQSPDFFDAATHPSATFEITAVEPFAKGDEVPNKEEFASDFTPASDSSLSPATLTHWISGNLTIRGTAKNIKFPASISVSNGSLTTQAGFNIDRTAWGLSYGDETSVANKAKDKFIYNTVSVALDIKTN